MYKNNLYYKRGIYYIDKLLKMFNNDSTFYKNRAELLKIEINRMSTNKNLVNKDINSFYITALVSLLGLNKENIEKMDKHGNYSLSEFSDSVKKMKNIEQFRKTYPEIDNDRTINTIFDEWLSVENCDHPTLSYMMNIRNGILHSEYEPLDEYGDIISVRNSNYTHFKSKVITPGLLDFCMFYFGNNSWTGILENFNIYELEDGPKLTNESEVKDRLRKIKIVNVDYELKDKKNSYSLPEFRTYNTLNKKNKNKGKTIDDILKKSFGKIYDYNLKETSLTEDQIEIIYKMVEKYYGEKFYQMDIEAQNFQLQSLTRYFIDSRSTLSEWICDFIDLLNVLRILFYETDKSKLKAVEKFLKETNAELNKRSIFACRTSLLIVKLYHILYRFQNKKYEEIDYNKINFNLTTSDYNYERIDVDGSFTHDFNIDKTNIKIKNLSLSDKEAENKVICEVIRNALSHGNIEMNFKIENNDLIEYIRFEDIYHSKSRNLEITLEKLEKFLDSDAFKIENCLIKSDSEKVKSI